MLSEKKKKEIEMMKQQAADQENVKKKIVGFGIETKVKILKKLDEGCCSGKQLNDTMLDYLQFMI